LRFDSLIIQNLPPKKLPIFQLIGNDRPIWFVFKLGTPGQFFSTFLNFNIIDFIVVDSNCGKIAENCPRFCTSGKFLCFTYNTFLHFQRTGENFVGLDASNFSHLNFFIIAAPDRIYYIFMSPKIQPHLNRTTMSGDGKPVELGRCTDNMGEIRLVFMGVIIKLSI
jgi:hypothetical protein